MQRLDVVGRRSQLLADRRASQRAGYSELGHAANAFHLLPFPRIATFTRGQKRTSAAGPTQSCMLSTQKSCLAGEQLQRRCAFTHLAQLTLSV
eukprot:2346049-Pleurochrysis_carterae.AAC.2